MKTQPGHDERVKEEILACVVVKPIVFTTTLIRNNDINFSPV
jgi:hypothetical protein